MKKFILKAVAYTAIAAAATVGLAAQAFADDGSSYPPQSPATVVVIESTTTVSAPVVTPLPATGTDSLAQVWLAAGLAGVGITAVAITRRRSSDAG